MLGGTLSATLVFMLLCLIWGSTWMFIKIGLEDAPPFLYAGLRFLLAALLMFPIVKLRGQRIPRDRRVLRLMVNTGLFAVSVTYGLVYWSEQYIPAGLTSVLFSAFPFFVILFSHLMIPDDRLSSTKIGGTLVGFSGLLLIFLDSLKLQNRMAVLATAAVVFSAICTALSNVVIKKNVRELDPFVLTFVHMLCGAVALLGLSLGLENLSDFHATVKSLGSLAYLAVMGSCVAFIGYYWLLGHIKVTTASLIVFVIPIVALFLDWIVLHQVLDWRTVAGSGLVIAGVGVASR